jgi:hypothetical protein
LEAHRTKFQQHAWLASVGYKALAAAVIVGWLACGFLVEGLAGQLGMWLWAASGIGIQGIVDKYYQKGERLSGAAIRNDRSSHLEACKVIKDCKQFVLYLRTFSSEDVVITYPPPSPTNPVIQLETRGAFDDTFPRPIPEHLVQVVKGRIPIIELMNWEDPAPTQTSGLLRLECLGGNHWEQTFIYCARLASMIVVASIKSMG